MVDFRFLPPDLRALDDASAEVVVACIFEDERPFRGLAGLLDWRLSGRLSRLARASFVRGALGEALVVPARPRLPFDKLVLMGAGARSSFDEPTFRRVVERVLDALAGLQAKKALLELPGRGDGLIEPSRAADVFFDLTADQEHDTLALVEDAEGQKVFEARALERRRSKRRAGT